MARKLTIGILVVFAALGVWGGVQAWYSPVSWMRIQGAAAFLMGITLLFMTWLWSRATTGPAGVPQFSYFPLILPAVAILVSLLPGSFWPDRELLQIGASAFSIVLSAVALILILRWHRKLWAARMGRA